MTECDSLMNKLSAIEAKLNRLQKCCSDKPTEDELMGKLVPAITAAMAGTYVTNSALKSSVATAMSGANALSEQKMNQLADEILSEAKKIYEQNKAQTDRYIQQQGAKIAAAEAEAKAAKNSVQEFNQKHADDLKRAAGQADEAADRALAAAKQAQKTANAAASKAANAEGIARKASSAAKAAQDMAKQAISMVSKLADDVARALSKALEALGISKAAQKLAMKALSQIAKVLAKVFFVIDMVTSILSILNAIDMRGRMKQLEIRMAGYERDLDILFQAIQTVNRKAAGAAADAAKAIGIAEAAKSLAHQAQGTANAAKNIANQAKALAVANAAAIAINTAGIAANTALATAANGTANRALQQKSIPGPQGKQGPQGIQGQRGLQGQRGQTGTTGRQGARGIQGQRGQQGARGAQGPQGIQGPQGKPGQSAINTGGQMTPADRALLQRINATTTQTKVAQTGHISMTAGIQGTVNAMRTTLDTVSQFSKKTWDFLQIDRILAVMTWIGIMHNAYFLSRNIADTLFYMISQGLNLIGVESAEGGPIDIGAEINKFMNQAAAAMIGEENLEGIKAEWAQHSRTYQAAQNLMYSIRNLTDSIHMALEGVGQYIARIGNALKRSGTILENSFGYMNENVANVRTKVYGRWEKAFQTIEQTDSVVSSMAAITSDVANIADSTAQVAQARADFATAVAEETSTNTTAESEAKLNSEAPVSLETANPYTVGERTE